MGVYIKGMEMPTNCDKCLLSGDCPHDQSIDGYTMRGDRPRMCPLVPVPDHGRLGDMDELYKEAFRRSEKKEGYYNCLDAVISAYDIENAPTIIPASKEGEKANILIGTDMNGGVKRDENGNVIDWGITGPPGDPGEVGV